MTPTLFEHRKADFLLSLLTLFLLFTTTLSFPAYKTGGCRHVWPGQSIQKAIDAARPGECIEVFAGTYKEQLKITADRISIIGHNAILVPPNPRENLCTGLAQTPGNANTQTGICIHGKGITLAPFTSEHRKVTSVGRFVSDVRIKGIEVRGFTGIGIAILGGNNIRISHTKLANNVLYGLLSSGSKHTWASYNAISADSITALTIAMCMDDDSGAEFTNNDINGYLIGLCGQTPGGLMKGNKVANCCLGAVADPGVRGLQVRGNHFSARNPVCDFFPMAPGAGVVLLGSTEAQVQGNSFEGMRSANKTAVGVFLTDSGSAVARGNVVKRNTFRDNDFDIVNNSTGANFLQGNGCAKEKSVPGNYCG